MTTDRSASPLRPVDPHLPADRRVADELELRALVARYADAVNARDREGWAATWAEDCSWDLAGHEVHGRPAVVATWERAMAGLETVVQLVHHGTVTVGDDRAEGRWTLSELVVQRDGRATVTTGWYLDAFRRTAVGWRFTRRSFGVAHRAPADPGERSPFPPLATSQGLPVPDEVGGGSPAADATPPWRSA